MSITSRKQAVILALTSFTVLACIAGLTVLWEPLATLDRAFGDALKAQRGAFLDYTFVILTSLADAPVLLIADVLIVLVLLAAGCRRRAAVSGFVLLLCSVAVHLLKGIFERERPLSDLYEGFSAFSFPSGHAANGTATALILLWLIQAAAGRGPQILAAFGLAAACLLIGLSRIYLGAHWPTDVVAGYALALCLFAVAVLLFPEEKARCVPRPAAWSALGIWLVVGGLNALLRLESQLALYLRAASQQ